MAGDCDFKEKEIIVRGDPVTGTKKLEQPTGHKKIYAAANKSKIDLEQVKQRIDAICVRSCRRAFPQNFWRSRMDCCPAENMAVADQ